MIEGGKQIMEEQMQKILEDNKRYSDFYKEQMEYRDKLF